MANATKPAVRPATRQEMEHFFAHCAFIRSIFVFSTRVWRDSSERDQKIMDERSPTFVRDIGDALAEYVILSACRVTDPAVDPRGNENLTVETIVKTATEGSGTRKALEELAIQLDAFGAKLRPVRNKLLAHADRVTIERDQPLGGGSWAEWAAFWITLREFVQLASRELAGNFYDPEIAGVEGDGAVVVRAIRDLQTR